MSMDSLIGQSGVKTRLKTYLSAYKTTKNLPFLNFVAPPGCGKTHFCRVFRENLGPVGKRPPMIEINAASIKKSSDFFDEIVPEWVANDSFLFIDEAHNLPHSLQEAFLTILNIEKNKIRTYIHDNIPYTFDFNKLTLALGTTDQQKLSRALNDRLTLIAFEEYSDQELMVIFRNNLDGIKVLNHCDKKIVSTFRGNPRDAVKKTQDLYYYCAANKIKVVNEKIWVDFCKNMGILPYGLNSQEVQVLKAIAERNKCSLQTIQSATGFSTQLIRKTYESYLVRKKLMYIDGQRFLTKEGTELASRV